MAQQIDRVSLTGHERTFDSDEFIVSKTNLKGNITYANNVFLRIAGYREDEVIGAPHSIVRHPDMPRCVFKLLWDQITAKKEIFAYVVNTAKNGDHYWVIAHVTPSFNQQGEVTGFHSNRRKPKPEKVEIIKSVYGRLLEEEASHEDRKIGLAKAGELLASMLAEKGISYDEFVLSI
ncbi:MAG: PAS domain S-box protein [Rhodospirillaceae bacterium]|jgi:PAS domain S-box-containing protein|nr:PAS domain S-box protein [Rhodospirillaceae bacterium]